MNIDTELPEHVLQWALDMLKVAVHRNLEGARKHYETYGIYDANISIFCDKRMPFYFYQNFVRYLVVWICYERPERARSEHRHGF